MSCALFGYLDNVEHYDLWNNCAYQVIARQWDPQEEHLVKIADSSEVRGHPVCRHA
jgi:hypothetical protein